MKQEKSQDKQFGAHLVSPLHCKPAPKKSPSKPAYGPVSALIVTLGAFFGAQLFAGLLIGAYIAVTGKDAEAVSNQLLDSTSGQFVFTVIVELATLALIYWFVQRRKITLAHIGLGRGPTLGDLGMAAIFFVGYFIALAFIMQAIDGLIPAINLEQEQQIGFESATGFGPLLMVFISLVVFPPIIEEIMVRGFLYTGLRQKLNRYISIAVPSIIFGIAHLQLGSGADPLYVAAIDTFFLSVVLIVLREKTGSLWSGMMVHAMKNGLAFLALFVFKTQ